MKVNGADGRPGKAAARFLLFLLIIPDLNDFLGGGYDPKILVQSSEGKPVFFLVHPPTAVFSYDDVEIGH